MPKSRRSKSPLRADLVEEALDQVPVAIEVAAVPARYGPPTTIYNRFNRWRKAGVWDRLMDAITKAHDGNAQMIDTSVVRVHQQGATGQRG